MSETYVLLVGAACEARQESYSPYSGFRVGAALLCADGRVVTGTNVENASFGLSICAERSAVFAAVAAGAKAVTAIAICADGPDPTPPCGACRQVLYEKESQGGESMELILYGSKKIQVVKRVTDLLPLPFKLKLSS